MTTISELFYQRKSRFSRNDINSGLDSSFVDRIPHNYSRRNSGSDSRQHNHHHNLRRSLHDLHGCDTRQRSNLSHPRHPIRRPSFTECDSLRLDEGSSHSALGNITNLDSISSVGGRPRFSEHDRLPGAVILARERLLQRLRGFSLSGDSLGRNTPYGNGHHASPLFNNRRFADDRDHETQSVGEWPDGVSPFLESQTDWLMVQGTRKQSAGLSQDELKSLHVGIFSHTKTGNEELIPRASQDCSICLESFMEGDKLVCLPCGHIFHSLCLDPWIQNCGDCPNCRTGIVVANRLTNK